MDARTLARTLYSLQKNGTISFEALDAYIRTYRLEHMKAATNRYMTQLFQEELKNAVPAITLPRQSLAHVTDDIAKKHGCTEHRTEYDHHILGGYICTQNFIKHDASLETVLKRI